MGELIKTFVNEGGDTGFMSVLKIDPAQQGSTASLTTDYNEVMNTSIELSDGDINSQIEQAVADSIQNNVKANPEGVQAALAEGITALTKIESRIKADSGIFNYQGIDIEASHNAFIDFASGKGSVEVAAIAMSGDIRAIVATRGLTASEVTRLQGVLTGLTGNTDLAAAYMGLSAVILGDDIDKNASILDNVIENSNKLSHENRGNITEQLNKNEADPVRDVLGPGKESHPEEWNGIIRKLKESGVDVVEREGAMAYAPQTRSPGQLIIDPNASITAILHEYQHYLENMEMEIQEILNRLGM